MNKVHIICKKGHPHMAVAGVEHAEEECEKLRAAEQNGEGKPRKSTITIVTLSVHRREPSEYNFPSTRKLRQLFESAKIPFTAVEIPNQYWPETPDYDHLRDPWLRVFTQRGIIVIGWRKNVISIDWSDSTMEVPGSSVVFKDNAPDSSSSITHWERGCHAWGYEEAEGCLSRLWARAAELEENNALP
jgi:hypothetical protein